jgi:ribosomal protein S18 acetylase RimI-like enzyme
MDEAEREARQRGMSRMTLGVRLELEENRRFFRSCGFEDAAFKSHAGFNEPTWVLMERRLNLDSR